LKHDSRVKNACVVAVGGQVSSNFTAYRSGMLLSLNKAASIIVMFGC